MQKYIRLILIISLLSNSFAWAADMHFDMISDHSSSSSAQHKLDNHEHDEQEHHAHHGCHLSSHMLGLNHDDNLSRVLNKEHYQQNVIDTLNSRTLTPPTKPPTV